MADHRQHDITIGEPPRGFMLARARGRGRAWRRGAVASVPGASSPNESRFGSTSPNVAFREVFDDFSGGDGHAYRAVAPPNGVHWSENFDNRWPGQAVHCQALRIAGLPGQPVREVVRLADLPPNAPDAVVGLGNVVALSANASGGGLAFDFNFLQPTVEASQFSGGGFMRRLFGGRPATAGSYHYVGVSSGNFVQVLRDLTSATDAGLPGAGFVTTGARLWRYHGRPNGNACLVQSCDVNADPLTAGNWSATLTVGDGITPIADMIALEQQVFCGLPDGLYAGDSSGTFRNVTGPLAGQANRENCRDLVTHEGQVVFPAVGGVFAYNPTTTNGARLRAIYAPESSRRSPVNGPPRAVASYAGWLYAGVWTGSASFLRAGREVAPGDWRWHTLNRLPHVAKVSRLHVDGITLDVGGTRTIPNRMWVATDASINYDGLAGTAPLYHMPIPRLNGNPLAPDPVFSANYVGSARLDLPAIDRNAPGVAKIGETLEVWADGFLSGSRYADVYYTADRGARTLLGRVQTSPVSTLLMGSVNGSFVTFRSLELSIESFALPASGSLVIGTCPVYRAVVLMGNLRADHVETIEAVVAAADGTPDRRGTPMRPAAVVLDDLRELADTRRLGGQPHRLVDLAGATSYVVFDGMPEETESYQEGREQPELTASIRLVVMTLSQNAG